MLFKISDKIKSTTVFRHFLLNSLFLLYDFKIAQPCIVNFKISLTDGRCNLRNTSDDPLNLFPLNKGTRFSLFSVASSDETLDVEFTSTLSYRSCNVCHVYFITNLYYSLLIIQRK